MFVCVCIYITMNINIIIENVMLYNHNTDLISLIIDLFSPFKEPVDSYVLLIDC